jgi:uroporphyrinogen decarboxylase
MEPLLVRSLKQQKVERPPVWIMRQAGRYLSEYRQLREAHSFLDLCKTPELAAQVTLLPIQSLDPDAAIIFSDILLIGESLGLQVNFNPGPQITNPLRSVSEIGALRPGNVSSLLSYVFRALAIVKQELSLNTDDTSCRKAVIGFAGAPWTLACYFVSQGPYKHFEATQVLAHQDPKAIHMLLEVLTQAVIDYLLEQIASGADAVQLFDTWAGNLSLDDYRTYALPYVQKIFAAMASTGCPTILYANGTSHLLSALKDSGASCISVDWRTCLQQAENTLGPALALQGNLDPALLCASPETLKERTELMLSRLNRRTGYVANLGHGILQTTPPENARLFVDLVKKGWGRPC